MTHVNPMDIVNQIINSPTASAVPNGSIRFLVCDRCNQVHEHDMATLPPAVCPKCNEQTTFKVMPSLEKAEALRRSRLQPAGDVDITKPHPSMFAKPAPTPAPVAPAPVQEPAPEPSVAPAPVTETPKATRTRKKAEPAPAPTPGPAPVQETAHAPLDYKAAREAATNNLIRKHGINEVEIKPVGVGVVFTLGFTRWMENDEGDRVPVYTFMELTDTPASFKDELNAARREDGTVTVDVARITGLAPEISSACFGGELIASLKNSTGPVRVMVGAHVKLGARLSKSARLIWFVLGVEK